MPDTQWGQTYQNVGIWSRERFIAGTNKENGWLVLMLRNSQISQGFSKASLKAKWRRDLPGCVISLCTILWSILGDQSLGTNRSGSQVLMIFKQLISSTWWWFLAPEKLRKYVWNSLIWVLWRGATAEDMGEGSAPGKAPQGPAELELGVQEV